MHAPISAPIPARTAGSLAIRPALPSDARRLAVLAQVAYAKYVPRMPRPPAPMLADYDAVVREGRTSLAEADGAVCGMVTLVPGPDHMLLRNLAVDPGAQGRGVGGALLAFAEDETLRLGLSQLRLWTNEKMPENVPFYSRRGFRETHRGSVDGYALIYFAKTLPARQHPLIQTGDPK